MFTCAHCGASLQSPKQVCARCNGESPLVLPTLQGFGEEVLDDGVKTLLSPRSEGELRAIVGGDVGHTDDFAATANLVSPIPSMPKIDAQVDAFSDQKSFLSDTETEVISHHRNKHTLEGLNSEDAEFTMSEEEGLSIEDLDLDQEPKELLQSSSVVDLKVSTTPPPIPPPMQSIGGTHLKGLENPFKQSKPGELKKSYQALWLSSRGKHRKSALN